MNRRLFLRITAALVAVVCVLVTTGVLSAQGRGVGLQRAIEVQERNTARLMEKQGVVGTAVGLDKDGSHAVVVLLEHGNVAGIPAQLDGVKVRKKVTGKIYAQADTAAYARPVPIGVSTGHPNVTAGTIGCRVTDGTNVYALSNNHVYADENNASTGDPVLQPGGYDGGTVPEDVIGNLTAFEPIVFRPSAKNTIDAAIAITSEDLLGSATPAGAGYGTPSSETVEASLGMPVQKRGRTTLLTRGTVTYVNATIRVRYDSGTARFVDQIGIEGNDGTSFSSGGDSGSLIVTDDLNCNPVGLLFAGNSTVTFANPIDLVLNAFGVTIDDSPADPVTDIAITFILAPQNVPQGYKFYVFVYVKNVGNQDVDPGVSVTLEDITDDSIIGTETTSSTLKPGEYEIVRIPWDTAGSSIGEHTLEASHDFSDDYPANDSKTATCYVEAAFRDIAISAVSAPSSVVQGDVVTVDVTFENVGNYGVSATITVTLTDTHGAVETPIGSQDITVSGLGPGASRTLSFTWDTATAGPGDHILTASHDFSDDDESNDSKTTTVEVTEPGGVKYMYASVDFTIAGPHLKILITVEDEYQAPVSGILVDADLATAEGDWLADLTGVTDSAGQIGFTLKGGKSGSYEVTVWDLVDTRDPADYLADYTALPVIRTWN